MAEPGRQYKDTIYEQFARIGKAVANPRRLEFLDLLCEGPRTYRARRPLLESWLLGARDYVARAYPARSSSAPGARIEPCPSWTNRIRITSPISTRERYGLARRPLRMP